MNFVEDSFILSKDISLAIVDKRITKSMENILLANGLRLIKTPECSDTYNAIKHHPDITICKLSYNNIVIAPNVYDYYCEKLKEYNFNIIKGSSYVSRKYPSNVQYNVAILGKFAIHNFKYTDKNIIKFLQDNNYELINVKQGYCKCSICIVDDNSIITSDEGIYKEVIKYGIDCLLIQKGHIDLFELDYGFIGGCSGLISDKTLIFFGDIKKHPDYNKINTFVSSKNKTIISLSDENLLDLGSLIPLLY